MLMHSLDTDHRVVLSYADLSVWCYACDSYVHNEVSAIIVPQQNLLHKLEQYQDCWCPGSLWSQIINSHDIDNVRYFQ